MFVMFYKVWKLHKNILHEIACSRINSKLCYQFEIILTPLNIINLKSRYKTSVNILNIMQGKQNIQS